MNPRQKLKWREIRGTQKKNSPLEWKLFWTAGNFLIKNPGKKIAGKKFNTGAVQKSPPHRAWVKTVIVEQAVLLALDHSSPKPSQDFHPSGIKWVCSPIQWRDRAGITPDFPIKPLRAPIPV